VGLVDQNVLGIDPNVKGYSWNNQKKKWGARIKVNGKLKHLGFCAGSGADAVQIQDRFILSRTVT
jgi:hypothetical protein